MHDAGKRTAAEQLFGRYPIDEVEAMESEMRMGAQLGDARFLERRIIIVVDAVDPDYGAACREQLAREGKADEARRAGDEDRLGRHAGHREIGIAALRRAGRC